MVMRFASFLLGLGPRPKARRSPIRSGMTAVQVGGGDWRISRIDWRISRVTVGFMRLPVAAGNDWWVVIPGCLFRHARLFVSPCSVVCFAMLGCLFRHARLFVSSCPAPTGHLLRLRPSYDGKLKEIVHPGLTVPSEAFFAAAGWGVVVKVHVTGSVDLLLCAELRGSLYGVLLIDM